jgi:hypothetical protein
LKRLEKTLLDITICGEISIFNGGVLMDDSTTQYNYNELLKKCKKLKNQLINIIEEKESLIKHKFFYLKSEYIEKIGFLEFELYELDLRLGETMRRIELVNLALESNIPFNLYHIESEVKREFEDFEELLKLKDKEIQFSRYFLDMNKMSDEEFLELKKYYKKTIRLIHPSINFNLSELQKNLWNKANIAYENVNLIYLKIIYKLAYDESINMTRMEDCSNEEISSQIYYFEDTIKKYLEEIDELKENFPFNKEELLKNETKVKEIRKDLSQSINEAKNILEMLEEHFLLILNDGQYIN